MSENQNHSKKSSLQKKQRPLSPHLSIYKPQISSILSIGHRLSGIGLFVSLAMICWWFIFWVFNAFDLYYIEILDNILVKIFLILTSYGFFYHLCTGIRHLAWDLGRGFSIKSVNITGWMVIFASLIFTISYCIFMKIGVV